MYGGGFNNNELFHLLKEEKLFSKLKKKSKLDIDKLKQMTAEKIIEELIREKLGSHVNLPNPN